MTTFKSVMGTDREGIYAALKEPKWCLYTHGDRLSIHVDPFSQSILIDELLDPEEEYYNTYDRHQVPQWFFFVPPTNQERKELPNEL